MKITLCVLVVLVMVGLPYVRTSSCINKNPYLSLLKMYDVQIYDSPNFDSDKCGDEWKENGTCCAPDSLELYAKHKLGELSKITNSVTSTIQTVLDNMNKVCKVIHISKFNFWGRGDCLSLSSTDPARRFYSDLERVQSLFSMKDNKCVNTIGRMRSNAVCSICSGKSQEYFVGVKAKFWNTDCLTVIDDCRDFWNGAINFLSQIRNFISNRNTKQFESVLQSFFQTTTITEYVDFYTGAHVLKNLQNCPNSSNCPVEYQIAICDNMVSLINPSLMDAINMILNKRPSVKSFAIVDPSATKNTQTQPVSSSQQQTAAPQPPQASNPAPNIGGFLSNFRFRRLLKAETFGVPGGYQFESYPKSMVALTDVSTVCSYSLSGCHKKSKVAMDLNVDFP